MCRYHILLIVITFIIPKYALAESELAWDQSKPIKIGSGVDLRIFGEAMNECLEYETEFETSGAQTTSTEIKIVDSYEKLVNELKSGANIEISSKAQWASYKANSNFKTSHDLEDYRKNESHSINVLVKIKADYGKRLAKNYKLKSNFQDLIERGDNSKFLNACGTHMVIGERRQSQVTLILTISELTNDSKKIVKNFFSHDGGISGNIKGLDLTASSKLTLQWSELVDRASRYGSVSASIKSIGGEGISEVEKIGRAMVGDLPTILNKLSEYASTFTQNNSSVSHYLLIRNESFGANLDSLDLDSFYKIRKLIYRLVEVDSVINELNTLRKSSPQIFEKHYRSSLLEYNVIKKVIVSKIDDCLDEKICTHYEGEFPNIHSLNDFIVSDRLLSLCSYRTVKSILTDGSEKEEQVLAHTYVLKSLSC